MSAPQRIGRYQILETIGRGGFATVYKARDPLMRRVVAIKVFTDNDVDLRRRFVREAQIAGSLDHPNVIRVFDCGFDETSVYLVEEYLGGEDLKEKIRSRAPVPYPDRLAILLQVASALEFAHSKGVLHRDIKPGNIRVLEGGRVKLMDFGIAKLSGSETPLTKAGTLLGTAGYIAPEQVLGKPVDQRADIFAFGALAYELITYALPFAGKTVTDRLRNVLETTPEPIATFWKRCPPALEDTVGRCLAKEVEDRYGSFTEVIADLTRIEEALRAEHEVPTSALPIGALDATLVIGADATVATAAAPAPPPAPALPLGATPAAGADHQLGSATPPGARATIALAPAQGPKPTASAAPTVAPETPAVAAAGPRSAAGTAETVPGESPGIEAPPPPPPGRRARGGLLAAATLAGVIVLGGVAMILTYRRDREPSGLAVAAPSDVAASDASSALLPSVQEPSSPVTGRLVIDAQPWGEVLQVTGPGGRVVELPSQSATPLLLAVPAGDYDVQVGRPSAGTTTGSCRVTVAASSIERCRLELAPVAPEAYFREVGWWR